MLLYGCDCRRTVTALTLGGWRQLPRATREVRVPPLRSLERWRLRRDEQRPHLRRTDAQLRL